jgi:hypothetical protein
MIEDERSPRTTISCPVENLSFRKQPRSFWDFAKDAVIISRPLAKVTFARAGKGLMLKGKGFLFALSPLPLTLFPTSL